ncbi:hypothetical protein CY0110_17992 [Crocosphaera chwakensis CCY0110]|uniref:Uncharacterized protein n=1 Tax=Crocosphaera chwakensis CCY0110 TaxID=391612 RepID=A3IIT0_9CHRO|nr:hypothetical protein CY0110_17992 [Crocosphaera chwakensis CCY0110]
MLLPRHNWHGVNDYVKSSSNLKTLLWQFGNR